MDAGVEFFANIVLTNCSLFDYGDEWRFYAILKEIDRDGDSDKEPEVVKEKGEPVEQYPQPGERW